MRVVVVGTGQQGMRVDLFLAHRLADLSPTEGWSRSVIQKMIAGGQVTLNGKKIKSAVRLKGGDRIEVHARPPGVTALLSQPFPLDILYEDEDCLVINKAPGIAVHPGAGRSSGTLVNAVIHHCPGLEGIGGERRPGIVHRLDKDTSGVMVIAKSAQAFQQISLQFKERRVVKEYLALVWGKIAPAKGVIDRPIGRHRADRKRMSSIRSIKRAREAVTEWRVTEKFRVALGDHPLSWVTRLRLSPRTGRTHQLRVHLAERGNPIVGDRVYGWRRESLARSQVEVRGLIDFPRQALHAESLAFHHPRTGALVEFRAPIWEDMKQLLRNLSEWHGRVKVTNEKGVDKQIGFT